jgi:hypothetical protein
VPSSFKVAARRGESVSILARRAIAAYLSARGQKLDPTQRLFMEVNLTNSHNPTSVIHVGETRTFDKSELDNLREQAENLGSRYRAWNRQVQISGYR